MASGSYDEGFDGGTGRERATPEDVMRALYVFVVAGGLASGGVAVFGAVALASAGGG